MELEIDVGERSTTKRTTKAGPIRVRSLCMRIVGPSGHPMMNKRVAFAGWLPSAAPYFRFFVPEAALADYALGSIKLVSVAPPYAIEATPRAKTLRAIDAKWLLGEAQLGREVGDVSAPADIFEKKGPKVCPTRPTGLRWATLGANALWMGIAHDKCDVVRTPLIMCALRYFAPKAGGSRFNRVCLALRALSGAHLERLLHTLRTAPWLLCFTRWAKKTYNLPELSAEGAARAAADGGAVWPTHAWQAVSLYGDMRTQRARRGHSRFSPPLYSEQALEWLLRNRALTLLSPDDRWVSFPKDAWMASVAVERIQRVLRGNSVGMFREGPVPCCPRGPFTRGQARAAAHIERHPFTIVEGGPGTGKTELIVWAMARFAHVLCVTYVGQMVRALRERLGGREEAAHTIHHVLCVAKYAAGGKEWLSRFDTLVVDECSNVDECLLGRLLKELPSLRSIILLGDLGQIHPIKAGAPFADLRQAYPQHAFTLVENKRVDPNALALARASQLIRAERASRIQFVDEIAGHPLVLTRKPPRIEGDENASTERIRRLLVPILAQIRARCGGSLDPLSVQMVALRRKGPDGCRTLNRAAEAAMHSPQGGGLGAIGRATFYEGMRVFRGQKITFTHNYGPSKVPPDSATVLNGELGIVEEIRKLRDGLWLTVRDRSHVSKRVFVSAEKLGISPTHVSPGYVCTSNKAQGSEWPWVIYWPPSRPAAHWTREYTYVAVSRASACCWVVGERAEIMQMCSASTHARDTALGYRLHGGEPPEAPQEDNFWDVFLDPRAGEDYDPFFHGDSFEEDEEEPMDDCTDRPLLDASVPCVPVMGARDGRRLNGKRMRIE